MKKLIALLILINLLLVAALLNTAVAASDTELILGGRSFHFDSAASDILNEGHFAVGVEYKDVVITYVDKNSWYEQSWFVAYAPDYVVNDWFKLTAYIGAATGYYPNVTLYNAAGDSYTSSEKFHSSGVTPVLGVGFTYYPAGGTTGLTLTATPYAVMFYTTIGL